MKPVIAFFLAITLTVAVVITASAQAAESIWLTASTTAYKTGETVIVTVNAVSATPIQGFTFQIRYDPACLQSVNATSFNPAMNGLSLPQKPGLLDASYASSTPQTVNGVLAEVRFVALQGCQTNLTLETAALAVRNESGFAAPLGGVTIGEKNVALNIDKALGVPQPTLPASASTLSLVPTESPDQAVSVWMISLFAAALIVIAGISLAVYRLLQPAPGAPAAGKPVPSPGAILYVKRGPYAGKSFALNRLPCHIGRDPMNEICLDDPHILSQHAQISVRSNGYCLTDLGGETFVNGRPVQRSSAMLKSGDVLRLGKSALLVFGS